MLLEPSAPLMWKELINTLGSKVEVEAISDTLKHIYLYNNIDNISIESC